MRSCVLSIRYGDTKRLVIVVVHGPTVVIFGRREMRGWQCSVYIEESVSKQVRDDAQVEIAYVVEVEDALECNDGEDSAVVVESINLGVCGGVFRRDLRDRAVGVERLTL